MPNLRLWMGFQWLRIISVINYLYDIICNQFENNWHLINPKWLSILKVIMPHVRWLVYYQWQNDTVVSFYKLKLKWGPHDTKKHLRKTSMSINELITWADKLDKSSKLLWLVNTDPSFSKWTHKGRLPKW